MCSMGCPAINKLESANLCSHIYPHDTARADIESKSSARLRVCVCVCVRVCVRARALSNN